MDEGDLEALAAVVAALVVAPDHDLAVVPAKPIGPRGEPQRVDWQQHEEAGQHVRVAAMDPAQGAPRRMLQLDVRIEQGQEAREVAPGEGVVCLPNDGEVVTHPLPPLSMV
jgi:hypothetical protein